MTNPSKNPAIKVLEPGQPSPHVQSLEPSLVPLGGPRAMTRCTARSPSVRDRW